MNRIDGVCDKAENMQHVLEVPPLPPRLNGPKVGSKTNTVTLFKEQRFISISGQSRLSWRRVVTPAAVLWGSQIERSADWAMPQTAAETNTPRLPRTLRRQTCLALKVIVRRAQTLRPDPAMQVDSIATKWNSSCCLLLPVSARSTSYSSAR